MLDKIPACIAQVIGLIERDMLGKFDKIKFFKWTSYNNDTVSAYFVTSLKGVCGFDKEFIDDVINDCTVRNVELVGWSIFDPFTLSPTFRTIEFEEHDVVIMLDFKDNHIADVNKKVGGEQQ